METKWTPGPWMLEKVHKWPFGIEIKGDGKWIFSESAAAHSSGQKTREDNESGRGFKGKDVEQAAAAIAEQDANAALVAAAPELYAALETLLDAAEDRIINPEKYGVRAEYNSADQAGRAALKKARGEQ